jgi:hypothetical protein
MALRTIIDEHDFIDQLRNHGVSTDHLNALRENFDSLVAAHPEIFPSVPGTKVHRIVVNPFRGIKRLNLWFTYDENTVTFYEVDVAE